jgi:arginyl-tRNA synthetase
MTAPIALMKTAFVASLKKAIETAFKSLEVEALKIEDTILIPEEGFGDLSTSVSFKISKIVKRKPSEIAKEIIEKMGKPSFASKLEEANGYINLFFNEREYAKLVIETVIEEGDFYGSANIGEDKKVLVEYPSVNPTKPWHIGHLRNALLGDSIANLLEFCGYKVEREDYIDDLGLQVAETLWGIKHLGSSPKGMKFDRFLGEQYVDVNKRLSENPEVEKEIGEILKKMEAGNTEEARMAREVSERCVRAQYQTAYSYGLYHDVLIWESDIVKSKLLDKAKILAQEKGVIENINEGKYKGCIVLDLEKVKGVAKEFENPKEKYKVLIRSNGVATYAMKDFAFHLWKFGEIKAEITFELFDKQPNGKQLYSSSPNGKYMEFGNADMVINIIDRSQSHEQASVKALLSLVASGNKQLIHLPYGVVRLASGTLSGRRGGWLGEREYTADELLKEATIKTLEKTKESSKLAQGEVEKTAKEVAIAAIKFEYLRVSPEKDIVFDWERALNLEANSGPYVLYTYARASSILEKGGFEPMPPNGKAYEFLTREEDYELVKHIAVFPEVVERACKELKPNLITNYLIDIATIFSKFYEKMPVIKSEARELRLSLVYATKQVIKNGLALLGVHALEAL